MRLADDFRVFKVVHERCFVEYLSLLSDVCACLKRGVGGIQNLETDHADVDLALRGTVIIICDETPSLPEAGDVETSSCYVSIAARR